MATTPDFDALRTIFHEPARLAIMSALCAADARALTFTELKTACDLTDGNLSRHLTVLEEAKAIAVRKEFADRKPRTTIRLLDAGLDRFNEYLTALEDVLEQTRRGQRAIEQAVKARGKAASGAVRRAAQA